MSKEAIDANWKRIFRQRLLRWFQRRARDLPWRESRDPYRIWVSEIMLQQTQVATVKSYFERFVAEFPTIGSLAAASEHDVLRLWEGLGYYRRARQLHLAAKVIVNEMRGIFPKDADALRALPGIGRYTAGAILSIAFDAREPILEANTVRLFSRLLCHREAPTAVKSQRLLWSFAEQILPHSRCGDFNQALMELGATICTPRRPICESCPVATLCPTRAQRLQDVIPASPAPKKYEKSLEACVVVWRRKLVLLRRCSEGERWAGLWDFPRFPLIKKEAIASQLATGVHRLTGITIDTCERVTTIKHGVTRFRITLDCYEADWVAGRIADSDVAWLKPGELESYPLSKTARRISKLLREPV